MKLNQQEVAAMAVSDKLELVRQMQNFGDDDDDARSDITSTSMETGNDDSSSTTDESPKMGRRKTVMRLTKKRGRPVEQKGSNLASRFMERYLKLAKDLRQVSADSNSIQNTLLSVAIITIKRKCFFAHTSSVTLTI